MRALALATVLCGALTPAGASDAPQATPFRLVGASDIVVPIFVGGLGPFAFLLDTGSSRSAVSDVLARRLRHRPVATTAMLTPVGSTVQVLVDVQDVLIGTSAPVQLAAMVLPATRLGVGIDGLIGQDVLSALTYTIDYERRMIMWHDRSSRTEHAVPLPLEFNEGRLLVSLPQTSGSRDSLKMIPDSGADGWVLFDRRGRTLPRVTPRETAAIRTLSDFRVVRGVLIDTLDVGSVRLRDQRAVLIDDDENSAAFADGLLPLHVFARVTFNGAERYMTVHGR